MNKKIKIPKKSLSGNNACYVLITCSNPSKDGKMEVEMDCAGDLDLAAFLIDSAQHYIHEVSEESWTEKCQN